MEGNQSYTDICVYNTHKFYLYFNSFILTLIDRFCVAFYS